jgi:H+/Cl- antiporter ClcA
MNGVDLFLQLPITAQAAVICFAACASCLFTMLLAATRRNCFFFRWHPETRFLALLVSPALLIIWPIALYAWFLKSRGIGPDDLDFDDD